MAEHSKINNSSTKDSRYSNCNYLIRKDSYHLTHSDDKADLHALLELLNTTHDINLQLKLFSSLSAYLMSNKESNLDVIIKSSAVYDKIHNVLDKGLPLKATEALNFLSALLYVDAEEGKARRKTLAIYARNMTRISGCLATMIDMFTNCMMYHDTWKALCQCLAVVCSECEMNQSYCTHLIPVCVQKCSQTNIDILLVLQSLVRNHNRNLHLFLECNGISVFTRDLLHYDKCLQLLITVVLMVKRTDATSNFLSNSKVIEHLKEFLRLYGPNSQIGQKAMIILNHIHTRANSTREEFYSQTPNQSVNNTMKVVKHSQTGSNNTIKGDKKLDDTKLLMQNVMKEVFDYKCNGQEQLKKAASRQDILQKLPTNLYTTKNQRYMLKRPNPSFVGTRRSRINSKIETELSFSFLKEQSSRVSNVKNIQDRMTSKTNITKTLAKDINRKHNRPIPNVNNSLASASFIRTVSKVINDKSVLDLEDFRPVFSSTPVQNEIEMEHYISNSVMLTSNHATQTPLFKKSGIMKKKPYRQPRTIDKELRNRSLSYRFFSAINDSCTTLVKTVKSIFRKKDASEAPENTSRSSSSSCDKSCSYSFLNYMQKRDAVLNNKYLKEKYVLPDLSVSAQSCKTCNNTDVLKQKFKEDDYLKQTVKKLKLGINLYGCDFKKISKCMWPRESYMTPVVVHNLYRKLLTK